jgi:allatostatin receptor
MTSTHNVSSILHDTGNATLSCDVTSGYSTTDMYNTTAIVPGHLLDFYRMVNVVVPAMFGLIGAIGFLGNILVILVVVFNKQMQNTTNSLIVSLAVADLCFIIFCVPFNAISYVLSVWPFGNVWCKTVTFLQHVSIYASVYTLVVMSFDRYLGIVHQFKSLRMRTQRNVIIIIIITWSIILSSNIPTLFYFEYARVGNDNTTDCNTDAAALHDPTLFKAFFGTFFVFGYLIPLLLICILYGFILRRLICGRVPRRTQQAESIRIRKRVTKMVVIVVVMFAICWLPFHAVFIIQTFTDIEKDFIMEVTELVAICFAYMNSCVNPILYAFLSDNFRQGFRKMLCCRSKNLRKTKYLRSRKCELDNDTHI